MPSQRVKLSSRPKAKEKAHVLFTLAIKVAVRCKVQSHEWLSVEIMRARGESQLTFTR